MALARLEVQIVLLVGLALVFSGANADTGVAVFDVTKFGARADGKTDNNMKFVRTWVAACKAKGAVKVLIPPGEYKSGEVFFQGPCTASPITVEVQGTILALTDISEFVNGAWFTIQNVDNLVMDGVLKGVLNGNGESSWKYVTCKGHECDSYPPFPPTLVIQNVTNSVFQGLSSLNSKGVHIKITNSHNVQLQDLNIKAPLTSPFTNGVVVTKSNNISVKNSTIATGGGPECVTLGEGATHSQLLEIQCNN